jgi:uncharacterized protein with NAD-binding domain and iron-sulfur cluster
MSAAWHLSQQPGYEIHVYERSWRLGGKAASVRDANGRILDHGLHVWLGFYENAFRMMRDCYEEVERRKWGPTAASPGKLAHGRIDDAFFPEPHLGVALPDRHGDWTAWSGYFPPQKGLPGEILDEQTNPFTLANYLLRCFALLKTLMLSVIGSPEEDVPTGDPRPGRRSTSDETAELDFSIDATQSAKLMIERAARLLWVGSLTSAATLLQAVTILEVWLQKLNFAPQVAASAVNLMEAVAAQTRKLLRDLVEVDEEIRMRSEIIEIVLTIAVGLFRDRVLFDDRGLDSINQFDYREWLEHHGAIKSALDSRFLTGIYDLVFAYRDGNKESPALAAGVALRGALRMFFTYRGSMFWRIRSGMGDAVFAPLYKVLVAGDTKAKGEDGNSRQASPVQFHFLHELDAVSLETSSTGQQHVVSLKFKTRGDGAALDDLSADALDGQGCWPDRADDRFAKALKQGAGARALSLGKDFEGVIFAMGIDDFRKACAAAALESKGNAGSTLPAKWAKMCAEVKTVATQSAQVWLDKDINGLGWYRGSGLITGLEQPFDTWADMTHILAAERAWRGKTPSSFDRARSVAYFCAVLPESEIKKPRIMGDGILHHLSKLAEEIREGKNGTIGLRDGVRSVITSIANEESIALWPSGLRDSITEELNELEQQLAPATLTASWQDLYDLLCAAHERVEGYLARSALEEKVNSDLTLMLTSKMKPLWPAAFKRRLNASNLVIGRYVQANFEGSDRYTQSIPGSIVYRISPLDRSVENMTIAGDWTSCGLDAGCVEAAVMSGMLAAYAISGKPDLKSIIGYDHP